jgi:hypothetical protein
MIKELVDIAINKTELSTHKLDNPPMKAAAFVCNSKQTFIDFIHSACEEIEFKTLLSQKTIYYHTEKLILEGHLPLYDENDKIYALIIMYENNYYHFYSRNVKSYDAYKDWKEYTFFDYKKELRKQKLKKLSCIK